MQAQDFFIQRSELGRAEFLGVAGLGRPQRGDELRRARLSRGREQFRGCSPFDDYFLYYIRLTFYREVSAAPDR